VPGGEKDSVVYLGKSSFKMKVGVRMTPPAGTAPTVPPTPRVTPTPPPVWRTSRVVSQSGSHTRPPVTPTGQMVPGVALAKSTLIGLCLTAFSCGIMCTVAVDRYWPRARTECGGTQTGATHAAAPTAPVEVAAPVAVAPTASVADVTMLPPYGEKLPTADKVVAAEVEGAAAPAAPAPAVATAPAPQARAATRTSPALRAPAPRAAAPARTTPAQGRAVVRKRPGPATAAADKSPSSPTESWTDPFAQ
jgi:hypothetical protein